MSEHQKIPIRILNGEQTRALLDMEGCIEAVRQVMPEVSAGKTVLPLRHGLAIPNGKGMMGMMYGATQTPAAYGIKLVSLFKGNAAAGLSSHLGLLVLYEPDYGKPIAIMDGSVVTAIRTAAASAVATDVLARPDASILTIIGTGEQAQTHIEAIGRVRALSEIRVWGRSAERAQSLVDNTQATSACPIVVHGSVAAAVSDADIVCTVTAAERPILSGSMLTPGVHVNVVGSSVPDRAEVDSDLVVKSRFFVDYRASTLAQAAEFLAAREAKLIDDSHIIAELGELLNEPGLGRHDDNDITVYKSLGIAAQDIAAGAYVLKRAQAENIGTLINF